jgi:hypothetical protein
MKDNPYIPLMNLASAEAAAAATGAMGAVRGSFSAASDVRGRFRPLPAPSARFFSTDKRTRTKGDAAGTSQ